jgi:formylmethanofuran dehydrogenase subunit A
MITRLFGGECIDGVSKSEVRDLYLVQDKISSVSTDARSNAEYNLSNHIVVAGGIDLHTHIGGGKVNIARLLLPEMVRHGRSQLERTEQEWQKIAPLSSPVPGTWETGRRYLEMGYTACFEPAVLPANARHAHAEMADTPWLDTGGYLLLGNDRLLLEWISKGAPQSQINDYVAWMIRAHQCCAIKVVNAGGIDAFKFNQRHLDVDEKHCHFSITPRQILKSLSHAVESLGLAHPLHVHCSNLGVAGNIASTMATIDAVEGRRLHLTHAQFHCFGTEGPHGYCSAAKVLADRVNAESNLSIDVGQMQFGQTVTLSGDTMHQFANRKQARPRKSIFQDLECQAGCGVLPFRYRHDQYVHSLLWAIGLELFLRIEDPLRVFLTTDHPNGAPFTAYPHLIHLLMSYDFRMSIFERLHAEVQSTSSLASLKREYSLDEIIKMTRLGPARALGLSNRGTLSDGGLADVVIYERCENPEHMFARPKMVFRRGNLVYHNGDFLAPATKSTIVANVEIDANMDVTLRKIWPTHYGYSSDLIRIHQDELLSDQRNIEFASSATKSAVIGS